MSKPPPLRPLVRQLFWTYAAYVWLTNLSFGLLSALAPAWLLAGPGLRAAVAAFDRATLCRRAARRPHARRHRRPPVGDEVRRLVEARATREPPRSIWKWLLFAARPGMRPGIFRRLGGYALPGAARLIRTGSTRLLGGFALLVFPRLAWQETRFVLPSPLLAVVATVPLLVGLSLMLHCGLFVVLAGCWRLAGVDSRPLFRSPLHSRSLRKFCGRRWNPAFSEMTNLAVYRPISKKLGHRAAVAGAFLFSGLLHELAISAPVRAGFALPVAYFALHGLLVRVEDWLDRTTRPAAHWGWVARVWTLSRLALPLPLLFHPWFLRGVVWPLIWIDMPAPRDGSSA